MRHAVIIWLFCQQILLALKGFPSCFLRFYEHRWLFYCIWTWKQQPKESQWQAILLIKLRLILTSLNHTNENWKVYVQIETIIYTKPVIFMQNLHKSTSLFSKLIDTKSLKWRLLHRSRLWWPKICGIFNWSSHCDSWVAVNSGKSVNLKICFYKLLIT